MIKNKKKKKKSLKIKDFLLDKSGFIVEPDVRKSIIKYFKKMKLVP
jgi:hypothetical protein